MGPDLRVEQRNLAGRRLLGVFVQLQTAPGAGKRAEDLEMGASVGACCRREKAAAHGFQW